MKLEKLGWNEHFQSEFEKIDNDVYLPARIIRQDKGHYTVVHGDTTYRAQVSGKFRYEVIFDVEYPATGDWVAIKPFNEGKEAIIHHVLERTSQLVRKVTVSGGRKVRDYKNRTLTLGGPTQQQVVAANIDYLFIVSSADENFNMQRIERFLLVAKNSGAKPVIVINKIDKSSDPNMYKEIISSTISDTPIHLISAIHQEGLDKLSPYITSGKTIGLFGSSGVGKSTIVNSLLDQPLLLTGGTRQGDDKGRHTTTWREVIFMPQGGIMIDTPGMRELQIWSSAEEVDNMFDDILELEDKCKFRDCSHQHEPGCAIKNALNDGSLSQKRYDNYVLMKLETSYLSDRKSDLKKKLTKRGVLLNKIEQKSKSYKY